MEPPFLKKYQPQKYKDFIIDESLISLLKYLIDMDSLNILLIGNSGAGKTSLLDSTIREYYNLDTIPKNNVLSINSLYDQGIQYYRNEVKTFCQTTSSIPHKKKFIVLDDIDFINDQSQQVFRNCIDKYSHNVNFLISCSNIQKVIDSIQSRSIILKLNTSSIEMLQTIFNIIKKKENIQITKKAEEFTLNVCDNSIRVLVNYLEKFKLLNQNITEKIAKEICNNISYYEFEQYTTAWYIEKNLPKAIKIIFETFNKGYSVMDILDSYFFFIKTTKNLDETVKYNIIKYICKYITIFHIIHEEEIELALFTHELKKNI